METIKSNNEIDFIFKNGEFVNLPFFKLIFVDKIPVIHGNVAFITGKKLGNAVWRNSAKRRLKNFYLLLDKTCEINKKQCLLLAKKNILNYKYSEQEKKILNSIQNEKSFYKNIKVY